jgi:hypothetical protein
MSWKEAKTTAQRIHDTLRAEHDHGFIGMVIDAIKRLHTRDKPQKPPLTPKDEIKKQTRRRAGRVRQKTAVRRQEDCPSLALGKNSEGNKIPLGDRNRAYR